MGSKSKPKRQKAKEKRESHKITFADIITRLIATWCLTAVICSIGSGELSDFSGTGLGGFILRFVAVFLVITVIAYYVERDFIDPFVLLGSLILFGGNLVKGDSSPYLILATFLVFSLALYYYHDIYIRYIPEIKGNKLAIALITAIGVMLAGLLIVVTVARYEISAGSTFDLGIFAQMYHNMREHFTMVTTCERNKVLSHLSIHTSLIYYLFLPVYYIFPHTETLLVLQALAVVVGIIPLYLITAKLGLNKTESVVICAVYALSPAAFGGVFYDFHENVFLIPILLFLFYFYESDRFVPTLIMAVLTCTVKEDAALFVIILGVYALLSKFDYKRGLSLIGIGGVSMAITFSYLAKQGEGLFTSRYQNLIYPETEGLYGILQTMITSPGYLLTQMFTEDKIKFLITVILPIGFMAFVTKKISRYILIVPFIFINMLPEYVYLHDIFYQYVFGPYVFVVYAAVLNISDFKEQESRYHVLLLCLLVGVTAFTSQISLKTYYIDNYKNDTEVMNSLDEAFDMIPADASVSSSTFFVPKLAKRDEIYMVDKAVVESGEIFDTDYAIFDIRPGYVNDTVDQEQACYINNGYEQVAKEDEVYVLLKKSGK